MSDKIKKSSPAKGGETKKPSRKSFSGGDTTKNSKIKKSKTKQNPASVAGKSGKSKKSTPALSDALQPTADNAIAAPVTSLTDKKNFQADSELVSAHSEKNLEPDDTEEINPEALLRGDSPMTVVGHLDEFRTRIIIVLSTVFILTVAGFLLSEYLIDFIMMPFTSSGLKLNIFTLTGGFVIRIKVAIIAAIVIGLPLLVFHVWRYIVPAISMKDRKFGRISLFAAVFLFYSGMCFVFFLLLPLVIKFLLGFVGKDMSSTLGADDYLSFILMFCLAMGVIFELPIIVMILTRIGILTPQFLIRKRKVSLVVIWIVAAVVTPPDVLSQVLVAIPLMFLYELSILISKMIIIKKKKKEILSNYS